LLLASWAVDGFVRLAPAGLPRIDDVRVNLTAVGLAFGIAAVAGVLFGLVPSLHIRGGAEQDALRGASRGLVTNANRRTRHTLVIVEVALSTVLLVGASLLVQSFVRLTSTDPGFRPESAAAIDRIELPMIRATQASMSHSATFFEQVLAQVRAAPGVDAAAVTIGLPLDPAARFFVDDTTFSIARRPLLPMGQRPVAALHVVSEDYFAAAGIPLRRGRVFDRRDASDASPVVIINETMARRDWPNEDPVGQTLTHDLTILPGRPSERRIVGVVADVRHFRLDRAPEPQMFIPHQQMPWPSMALLVRGTLPPERVTAVVRDAVRTLDPTVPVPTARPLEQVVAGAVGVPRFRAWLVGAFAGSALLLAMVGLYGTIAFSVQQRTRELGLRIALGASPADAMRLVLSSGLVLAAMGVAGGVVASAAITRLLSAMLFGVAATDARTFLLAPVVILLVAALASYLPARRAQRIEPLRALSSET
jgi:putative ABC transport system permease protein